MALGCHWNPDLRSRTAELQEIEELVKLLPLAVGMCLLCKLLEYLLSLAPGLDFWELPSIVVRSAGLGHSLLLHWRY